MISLKHPTEKSMKLAGKVGLVTGAGVRLGQQIALYLASQGMRVALHYHRSHEGAQATLEQMEGKPGQHHLFQADLTVLAELQAMVGQISEKMGAVSVLINNSADFYPTPFFSTTEAQWDALFALNLKAPFFLSQGVASQMQSLGEGKIIHLADISAFRPGVNYLPYCTSKAGLVTLTQGLAKALAPEIHVNAIAPGIVLPSPADSASDPQKIVEQSLLQRMGSAQDVVQAVDYLLHGDFLTGVVLPVDGGRLLG